jgi:D-3-phosphoglycerate dehydrogenase / 2-oxoglutarate reductase
VSKPSNQRLLKKVLFIDTVHPLIPEMLTSAGFSCDFQTEAGKEKMAETAPDYFGIIIRSRVRLDEAFLKKFTGLHFIGRVGAGMENIDVDFAVKMGVRCFNSPEGNRDAVGEHTLGMLLTLMNHIARANRQVHEGKWIREGNRGTEIKGKTVGIIGYGNMGSAFAQRLRGFEARVISYDKYKTNYADGNTEEVPLETLFDNADIVSLHIPLTEETRYLCNAGFFARFRKNIYFINTSRGKIVPTADLDHAIREGKVLGTALDVLEYEDSSFENLGSLPQEMQAMLASDKVIITPHIAGWTAESNVRLAEVLANKIIQAFK